MAVKILHPHLADDAALAERFADEARAAAAVSHPSLVAVFDTIAGPPPAIVMEWVGGSDLRERLDRGPMSATDVVHLGAEVCEGLTALHQAGLVHRDVKPANILLCEDGSPKLADFGIATAHAGDRTATGIVLGTAKYLSPEQVQGGGIGPPTDIYALACVLYEALAGEAPFVRDGDLPTALARIESDPVDLDLRPIAAPAGVRAAIMTGLRRDAGLRWPSAGAFAAALRHGDQARAAPLPRPVPPAIARPTTATPTTATPTTATPANATPTTATPTPMPPAAGSGPRPVRRRRRRWPRLVALLVAGAIGWLGWALITGNPDQLPVDRLGSSPPEVQSVTAFDPEGTGTPGEHDDLVRFAVDGDPTTAWHTERYRSRDLGTKSGVGLLIELEAKARVDTVEIRTDATGWAAEIMVTNEAGLDRASFGPARASGTDLDPVAVFEVDAEGRFVLVWITHLGAGPLPVRLHVDEVVIR